MSTVREHERRPSSKHTAHRELVMQTVGILQREIAVSKAKDELNRFHDQIGYRRRPANDDAFEPGLSEGIA